DGIRDFHVTGVQTCALPIWRAHAVEDHDVVRSSGAGATAAVGTLVTHGDGWLESLVSPGAVGAVVSPGFPESVRGGDRPRGALRSVGGREGNDGICSWIATR